MIEFVFLLLIFAGVALAVSGIFNKGFGVAFNKYAGTFFFESSNPLTFVRFSY